MARVNLVNNINPLKLKAGPRQMVDNLIVNLDNSITVQSKNIGSSQFVPGTSTETVAGAKTFSLPIVLSKTAVTQTGTVGTSVTANTQCGVITTLVPNIASGSRTGFTVYNSYCTSASTVQLTADDYVGSGYAKLSVGHFSGQTGTPGAFDIGIYALGATLSGALKIHFLLIP